MTSESLVHGSQKHPVPQAEQLWQVGRCPEHLVFLLRHRIHALLTGVLLLRSQNPGPGLEPGVLFPFKVPGLRVLPFQFDGLLLFWIWLEGRIGFHPQQLGNFGFCVLGAVDPLSAG